MTSHDLVAAFDAVAEAPDGNARLREVVLQLAVRGKLVPQDPADELASVLLARIAAEKEELVCSGRLRRQKMRGSAAECEFEVPQGWLAVWLGDILDLEYGKSLPAKARGDVGVVPVYGSNGVVGRHDVALVTEPCVVVGRKGSAGAVNISESACWPIDTTYFVCSRARMPLKYLAFVLTAARLAELDRATAIPGLNREEVYALPVPLPPLAEQHRIVARVDELMGLLDRLEATQTTRDATRAAVRDSVLDALRKADAPGEVEVAWKRFADRLDDLLCDPADITPLRQAVLQLAIRGRLVAHDPADEPASVLLERITHARARRVSDGTARRRKSPDQTEGDDPRFTLPAGWEWCRLDSLLYGLGDGPHYSPKYVESGRGVPFLSTRNLSQSGFLLKDVKYVSQEDHVKFSKRVRAEIGDVLYTKGGTTGIALVNTLDFEFSVWVHVAVLKVASDHVSPYYVALALNSPHCYEQSQAFTHGTGNRDLGLTRMVKITVPLPPLAEQHRIVARVDELMGLLDRLEERLAAARTVHVAFADAAVHQLDA